MRVEFGDILNQGRYAIYITNISEAGVLMQGNNLWMPSSGREEGTSGSVRYRNVAGSMGVEIGGWGYAGKFIDFNNDGNLDLYVDRKSTRLNSSHVAISYAVFCLKKKKTNVNNFIK